MPWSDAARLLNEAWPWMPYLVLADLTAYHFMHWRLRRR